MSDEARPQVGNAPQESQPGLTPPDDRPLTRRCGIWAWNILAGNPFYPLSALLLLWGISCCSGEAELFTTEWRQLLFDFSALQVYEAVVVAVAVFLARRRLWYDAALLVVLENGLMLVPLMLVMQALMITQSLAVGISLVAAILMATRVMALRRGVTSLNFPPVLAALGLVILAVNLSLPLVFRPMIMELLPDARETISRWIWYVGMPWLPALGFLLPRRGRWDGEEVQRCWLPLLLFGLWVAGTVVAVRSAEYVATLPFTIHHLASTCWVWGWVVYRQLGGMMPARWTPRSECLAVLPMAGALLPLLDGGKGMLVSLVGMNTIVLAILYRARRSEWILQAVLASMALLVAAMPERLAAGLFPEASRFSPILAAAVVYALIQSLRMRTPLVTGLGALAVYAGVRGLDVGAGGHDAVQAACAYYLLLSLAWRKERADAPWHRHLVAGLWVADSLWRGVTGGAGDLYVPALAAGGVLAGAALARWMEGAWRSVWMIVASLVNLMLWPCLELLGGMRRWPPGVCAVLSSFLLLGIGTLFALTRHRWTGLARQGVTSPFTDPDRGRNSERR